MGWVLSLVCPKRYLNDIGTWDVRFPGKGSQLEHNAGQGGQGDELINVMVYIPEKLSEGERSAIQSLQNSPNMQPTEAEKNRMFSKLKHIFGDAE